MNQPMPEWRVKPQETRRAVGHRFRIGQRDKEEQRMKNRIVVACLGILLVTGLAVLGSPALNSLVIGATQEPSNLCPWEGSADTKENLMGIFNIGLTYFDSAGVLQPGLATEIPTEANGNLLIFKDATGKVTRQEVLWTIRADAFWSDGTPITSDDAVFTFKVQNTTEMMVTTRAFSNLIEDVVKVSDKSFWIHYKTPKASSKHTPG